MSKAISGITKTLFGGSDSKSSSSQQSSSQLDPRLFALFDQNYKRAQNVANTLGPRQFAGYTSDYNAGADAIRNTVLGGAGAGTMGQGINYATQAGAYSPMSVRGGSILNANLDAYMNPFLQNVAGNTIADMDRARQIEMQQSNLAAQRAGAFGGSRHGVAEAETNRNFYDRLGSQLADLYATGFNSATGLATADMDRALTADRANQDAGLMANQQQLSAAELLANMGLNQQQMGLQGAEALLNLGLGQQEFSQAQLDAIRNLPLEQQGILNEALGINPAGGSGMTSASSGSSKSTSSSQNGIFKAIGLG